VSLGSPLSLSPPQKARHCSQRKAFRRKVVCEYEMYQSKPQTQICIFEAQIYSFLFQPSVQTARKYPKSLENKAFSAISCKIVISDKW
jgi:hypothetical protein